MKKIFTCLQICVFYIILFAPGVTTAQTLVGSWNFNGNANDGSGNGLNGTVYNATLTAGQSGVANTAYKFNGVNAHIDVPYSSLLNLSTFTIQAIVRIDSFNPNPCQQENILSRGTFQGGDYMILALNDNTHDNSCSAYSPNYTEFTPGVAGVPTGAGLHDANYIVAGRWYCHTVTYNGSVVKIYINGVVVDSGIVSNQYNFSNSGTVQPILTFGYYPNGLPLYPYWLNGAIDNISIWSGVIPDSVIAGSCGTLAVSSVAITQPFADTSKCAGSIISIPYTKNGFFNATNTFTAQLSNASGSFASPVNIGNVTSTTAGTITATIPASTIAGTGYRVRVVSSSPADTSAVEGNNIHISNLGTTNITNNLPVCTGDSIKLTASNSNSGAVYQYTDPSGTITTSPNRYIPNATVANAGKYALAITNGACVEHDTLTAVIYPRPNPLVTGSNTPICAGTYIGLSTATTTPGVTYSWSGPNGFTSSLQAPVINNAPLADSGRYYVSATANGCSARDSTYVVITPAPTLTASYLNPVCVGDSINIYATITTGSTYSWAGPNSYSSTSQNVQLAHSTAVNSGNYILTASRNGCFTRDTVTISVNPVPAKPTASSSSPVCAGTNVSLSALNITNATYIWIGPTGYGAAGRIATRTVAYTDSGNYIVGATVNGCTNYDTTHVTVLQAPTAVIYSGTSPICAGDILKLMADNMIAGVTYNWTGPNSYTSNQQNPSIPNITAANAGKYALTATLGTCLVKDTVTIVVKPLPNKPTITSNSPVCAGTTLSFSAVTTTGAQYFFNGPGFGVATATASIPGVMPANAGKYIMQALLNGCSAYDTANVTVLNAPLNVTYGSNSPICAGDTLKVTSGNTTAGVTYSWSGPNSFTASQPNFTIPNSTVAASGSYRLAVSLGSCTVRDTIVVAVNPLPNKPTITSNSPLCAGYTLSFNPAATAGATYAWSGPTGYTSAIKNATRTVAVTDSGYYIVKATLNGCSASDTTHVVVNPSPVGVNYSSNGPICTGDTLKVAATSLTPGVSYVWSGPGSFTTTGQNFNIPNAAAANAGNYYLAVTYNVCTVYDTLAVVIKPLPATPTASSNTPVCIGATLSLTSFSGAGVGYNWTGPNNYTSFTENPTIGAITAAGAGTYTVKATLNGCVATATTAVVVNPIPTGTATSNSPVCAGDNLQFTSSITPSGLSYSWTGPNGFVSALQNPFINAATVAASGTYNLSSSLGSCTTVLHVPVTITPLAGPPVVTIGTPLDTICGGQAATFSAAATNAGSAPAYLWKVNGVSTGATGSTYTTGTLHDGDLVTCTVTSNGVCQPVLSSSSNAIYMRVKVAAVPAVSIEVYPAVYQPGVKITYTAIVKGDGNCLTYQWRLNGVNMNGFNSSSFESYTLKQGDKISLFVHSSCSCTTPDTALAFSGALGVNEVTNTGHYKVYPNPAQDEITIEGDGTKAQVELYDMSGRQVWAKPVTFSSGSAKVQLSLPSGVYSLKLVDEKGNSFVDRVVILK